MRLRRRPSPPSARGATLIEVLSVVVIMSVLAMTATPAISTAQDLTRAAAVRELQRQIELARATASATGTPTGVVIDPIGDTVELQRIDSGTIAAATDGLGLPIESTRLGSLFGGADLVAIAGGLGPGESLWFDFDASPHRRDAAGAWVGDLETAATYSFADGGIVTVHPVGGMVE